MHLILTLDVYLGDKLNGMLAGVYLKEDTQKYKAGFTNRIRLTNSLIAVLFKCEKIFYDQFHRTIIKLALLLIYALFRR